MKTKLLICEILYLGGFSSSKRACRTAFCVYYKRRHKAMLELLRDELIALDKSYDGNIYLTKKGKDWYKKEIESYTPKGIQRFLSLEEE